MNRLATMTDAGLAIITHKDLVTLSSPKWGTNGSIALGLLLDDKGRPECWCFFWEWGGDWAVFEDGAENDAERLNEWMAPELLTAIEVANKFDLGEEYEEDVEWFENWADTAARTLAPRMMDPITGEILLEEECSYCDELVDVIWDFDVRQWVEA